MDNDNNGRSKLNQEDLSAVSSRVKEELNALIFKEASDPEFILAKGPNPQKTRQLYSHMALIHEALMVSNQGQILERLAQAGLPTTRPTLRRVYAKWIADTGKPPRIRIGGRKKKKAGNDKISQLDALRSKIDQ